MLSWLKTCRLRCRKKGAPKSPEHSTETVAQGVAAKGVLTTILTMGICLASYFSAQEPAVDRSVFDGLSGPEYETPSM